MGEVKVFTRSKAPNGFPDIDPLENHPLSEFTDNSPLDDLRTPTATRQSFQERASIRDEDISPKILGYINREAHDIPQLPRITAYLPAESSVPRSTQEKLVDYAQGFFLRTMPMNRLQEMKKTLLKSNISSDLLDIWERNVALIGDVVKARLSKEGVEEGSRTVTHHIILPLLYSVDDAVSVQKSW